MLSLNQLLEFFEEFRNIHVFRGKVNELYQPANYIMNLGGKRIRPLLCLVAYQVYFDEFSPALPAALAIEVFHNFSLMHDDIMDQSPLRRGKATVHMQFNTNAAILSGDYMLIHTYELLNRYEKGLSKYLIDIMNQNAVLVCEGQQRDINFENQEQVSEENYIDMVRDKTAVLLGTALQMGCAIAGQSAKEQNLFYETGLYAGIAFQLLDDYLDSFGDHMTGKRIGGDIKQNKKTLLYAHTMKAAKLADQKRMKSLYASDNPQKVEEILSLFRKYGADTYVKDRASYYSNLALKTAGLISAGPDRKENLNILIQELLTRTH